MRGLGFPPVPILGICIAAILLSFSTIQGQLAGTIDVRDVSPNAGLAFSAPVKLAPWWPTAVWGSEVGQFPSGELELFENGHPLGPGDTAHGEIRQQGHGRFSHWGQGVVFSSSDGSDPRTNGRGYTYRVGAGLPAIWQISGVISLALSWIGVVGNARHRRTWLRFSHRWLIEPANAATRFVTKGILVVTCLAATLGAVIYFWMSGVSGHLGLAGFLPVSDALGYYRCALALGDIEWCGRRDLYPLALQSLLTAAGGRVGLALLYQGAIQGLAIAAFGLVSLRIFGFAVSALVSLGLVTFAYYWSLGNLMTEALGFPAGLIAASLLLAYSIERRSWILAVGVAMLSFALTARAGAILALPLIASWGYWCAKPNGRIFHLPSVALMLSAVLVGPTLQMIGAWSMGANLANTGGNFATELYGLSTGTRDWSQSYRDFSAQFKTQTESAVFRDISSVAMEKIRAHPEIFFKSLLYNEIDFCRALFDFLGGGVQLSRVATAFMALGLLRCVLRWRSALSHLLFAALLGELISAPLIYDSALIRGFATTIWIRPLLAAVGLLFATEIVFLAVRPAESQQRGKFSNFASLALPTTIAGLLISLPLLAIASRSTSNRIPIDSVGISCPSGDQRVLAQIGHESMAITIGNKGMVDILSPLAGPLVVPPGEVEADAARSGAWYSQNVGRLPAGASVIYTFERQAEHHGRFLALFWGGPVPILEGGKYVFCVGNQASDRRLGDFPLQSVDSVTPVLE
jgi:hypothetical protein